MIRREFLWLGLAVAGVLMALPLGWISLILLLILPGLSVLLLLKDRITLSELIGISGTVSILFIPLAILATSPISVQLAGVLLGLLVVAIGLYGYVSRKQVMVETSDWQVQVITVLIFLIVLVIIIKTFVIDER
ncbi:MAG TPA: hypothetical protein VK436_04405, partial [Methanocella sp.]|nr:hypothetical protein [Methanocella sp.]